MGSCDETKNVRGARRILRRPQLSRRVRCLPCGATIVLNHRTLSRPIDRVFDVVLCTRERYEKHGTQTNGGAGGGKSSRYKKKKRRIFLFVRWTARVCSNKENAVNIYLHALFGRCCRRTPRNSSVEKELYRPEWNKIVLSIRITRTQFGAAICRNDTRLADRYCCFLEIT